MRPACRAAARFCLILLATGPAACAGGEPDVPYVPTPQPVVGAMLTMAEAGPGDVVYDLGAGDGRFVIAAVRDFNVDRAVGIDIDPARVKEARANAAKAGVSARTEFIQGDIFEADFSEASVVTLYLLPDLNTKLRPRLLEQLEPGTRVVSHRFDMDGWEPDMHRVIHLSDIYLWTVPAEAGGTWTGTADGESVTLNIRQSFQEVSGRLTGLGDELRIRNGRLDGRDLSFTAERAETGETAEVRFDGTVSGGAIEGTLDLEDRSLRVTLTPAP